MAFKGKCASRKDVLAAIVDCSSIFQVRGSIGSRDLVKDLTGDGRRYIRGDGDIVVVDHVVGQLRDLKKVGTDADRLATSAKGRSTNVVDNVSRRSDSCSHCRRSWFGGGRKRMVFCWMLVVGGREVRTQWVCVERDEERVGEGERKKEEGKRKKGARRE